MYRPSKLKDTIKQNSNNELAVMLTNCGTPSLENETENCTRFGFFPQKEEGHIPLQQIENSLFGLAVKCECGA